MAWQMSGGETEDAQSSTAPESEGKVGEFDDTDDVMEAMLEGGHDEGGEEASTAKVLDGAIPETVEHKAERDQK